MTIILRNGAFYRQTVTHYRGTVIIARKHIVSLDAIICGLLIVGTFAVSFI